jgi:hypothetical protein
VLARVLEANGIATTSISLVREQTEAVKPPRALWVPFPFGYALGRPNDPELQHRVLRAALALLDEPSGPVLRDLPDSLEPGDEPPALIQASGVAPASHVALDLDAEMADMVRGHAQWLAQSGGRTAIGLTGTPPERLGGAARFLEEFSRGVDSEPDGRPDGMPLPDFVRYCADDLKALYAEAYMASKPGGGDDIARWLWGETALGQVLRRVRDRLDASADPRAKAAAFGVAR